MSSDAVVLDTTAVSIFLKMSAVHEGRRAALEGYVSGRIATISFVTVAELLFWAESRLWSEKKRQDLEQRLRAYAVLDPTRTTADHWASKKSEYQKIGLTVQPHDMWIAAAGIQYDLTVVSGDKIFARIPDLKAHILPP